MMQNNIENQVVDIDGYIHVVNGKVICFKSGVYDLNNLDDVKELVVFLESVALKPLYGDQTMYILERLSDGAYVHMGDLEVFLTNFSEGVQKKIRLEILKQKNQIVDIGYVHVINGKVICFKSDVYDLNNSEDVQDLLLFVDDLSEPDNLFSGQIDDDTVIDLRRNSSNNEVIVGFGGYLPCLVEHLDMDVKEKVMVAVDEYRSSAGR